ncbi:MAG: phage tail protein [Bacteroidota bacterium]
MRFTLITEGVSENRIIKHILVKYFKEYELFFRDAQPQIVNEKQETIGGWNEVLKYCGRTDDLKEIFNNSDYLIIQIDTDQSETKPFDVSHSKDDNTSKTVDELYVDVVEKLKGLINPDILESYSNKIFFAICIHSIECWLIPIYYQDKHKTKTLNCFDTLNLALRKHDIHVIPSKNKNTPIGIRGYEEILKNWKKKQDIDKSAQSNKGFERFVESLKTIE